jgi:hypothetical protein
MELNVDDYVTDCSRSDGKYLSVLCVLTFTGFDALTVMQHIVDLHSSLALFPFMEHMQSQAFIVIQSFRDDTPAMCQMWQLVSRTWGIWRHGCRAASTWALPGMPLHLRSRHPPQLHRLAASGRCWRGLQLRVPLRTNLLNSEVASSMKRLLGVCMPMHG